MQTPDLIHHLGNLIRELFTLDPQEPFKFGAKVVAILGFLVTAGTTLITKTYPWLRAKLESRSVSKIFGEDLFTPTSIERSVRYYIPPSCQSIDPAGGEESRSIHSVQAPLFETFDRALSPESDKKYHILLADSGMGKTSAVINYCVRHQRRWRKKYHVAVVPLGIPDADERIRRIENKSKTALFLDALDEDTLAMVDHAERIRLLVQCTHEFRKVIITCRTQFFSTDEEIPRETGVLKITARSAGESAEQVFSKIYLAPFSDDQVKAYLKRRYPIWQWKRRKQAFNLVGKIPLLTARPMLLAHIEDLVKSERDFQFSFELYEAMVEAWIKREEGFIENSGALLDFSERLAADLFLNRSLRGAEQITKDELTELARGWSTPISDHKLSGRSLLNRDADGNFKFAHRSIMEYLFVQRFLHRDMRCVEVEWTDQMKAFTWEKFQDDIRNSGVKYSQVVIPDIWSNNKVGALLCEVLKFGLRTPAVQHSVEADDLVAKTILVLCSMILDPGQSNFSGIGLWFFVRKTFGDRSLTTGELRIEAARAQKVLRYASDGFRDVSVPKGLLIFFPPKMAFLRQFPMVRESSLAEMDVVRDIYRASTRRRTSGEHLVIPVFLGPDNAFLLGIESKDFSFNQNNRVNLLSKVFDPFRPPSQLLERKSFRGTLEDGSE
jgi:hypothetical protein